MNDTISNPDDMIEEEGMTSAPAGGNAESEGRKLYVGNLPYAVGNDDLGQLFMDAGQVEEAIVITDKFRGNRSKGFGFVTMATVEDARKAVEMFHEKEIEGRALVVNVARPREER